MIKCHFFCCRLEDSDMLNCCQGETVEGINEIERGLSGTEEGWMKDIHKISVGVSLVIKKE